MIDMSEVNRSDPKAFADYMIATIKAWKDGATIESIARFCLNATWFVEREPKWDWWNHTYRAVKAHD